MNLHTNLDLTQKPEKSQKKVAETEKTPKTASKTQLKSRRKAEKK